MNQPLRFIIVSICLHVLFWVALFGQSDGFIELEETPALVEIEIVPVLPPAVPQPTQVVEQAPPQKIELNDDAKFLSAEDQKVEKETRAERDGSFQNIDKSEEAKVDSVPDAEEKQKKVSQSEDYLKNIAKGMETVLNTRQFQYFAYYNLIKEKIRPQWEPGIREKFRMEVQSNRSIASQRDHMTQVLLVLNPQGAVMKIEVLRRSGSPNLDNAAVEAFRKAQPFPKPPPGLIESDGLVRLLWDFVLET